MKFNRLSTSTLQAKLRHRRQFHLEQTNPRQQQHNTRQQPRYNNPTQQNLNNLHPKMSESINTNQTMDTEPGGENTQYESQKTFTQTPSTATKPAISQFRDPETGTVHLPTHRKTRPADIKARSNQNTGEGGEQGVEGGEQGIEGSEQGIEEGGEGPIRLPGHRKVTPADIQARANEAEGKAGEGVGGGDDTRGKMGYGEGSGVGA